MSKYYLLFDYCKNLLSSKNQNKIGNTRKLKNWLKKVTRTPRKERMAITYEAMAEITFSWC